MALRVATPIVAFWGGCGVVGGLKFASVKNLVQNIKDTRAGKPSLAMGEMIPGQPLQRLVPVSAMQWLQLLFASPVVFQFGSCALSDRTAKFNPVHI